MCLRGCYIQFKIYQNVLAFVLPSMVDGQYLIEESMVKVSIETLSLIYRIPERRLKIVRHVFFHEFRCKIKMAHKRVKEIFLYKRRLSEKKLISSHY